KVHAKQWKSTVIQMLWRTVLTNTQQFVTSSIKKEKILKFWLTMNQVCNTSLNGGNNYLVNLKVKTKKAFTQQVQTSQQIYTLLDKQSKMDKEISLKRY